MSREKRLSPRRAQGLAFLFLLGRTKVRLRPLLILRPLPPIGGTPNARLARSRTLVSALIFDARLHSARLTAGVRLSPTARLQCKSTVCGLSGGRPCSAGRVEIWRGGTEVFRFQIPLIKPGVPISGTRLSDKGIS